jgi:hypothetical protein
MRNPDSRLGAAFRNMFRISFQLHLQGLFQPVKLIPGEELTICDKSDMADVLSLLS